MYKVNVGPQLVDYKCKPFCIPVHRNQRKTFCGEILFFCLPARIFSLTVSSPVCLCQSRCSRRGLDKMAESALQSVRCSSRGDQPDRQSRKVRYGLSSYCCERKPHWIDGRYLPPGDKWFAITSSGSENVWQWRASLFKRNELYQRWILCARFVFSAV